MFTDVTFSDWQASPIEKTKLIENVIERYKGSFDFNNALIAGLYFQGNNVEIGKKTILKADATKYTDANGKERNRWIQRDVIGNQIGTAFFKRFVVQENQSLLANGVTLDNPEQKKKLGLGFDHVLQMIGENALIHGVCYGFWNVDHLEIVPAAVDRLSGAVALLDDSTGSPRVLIQFWQLADDKPMTVRLFEEDGLTMYSSVSGSLQLQEPKRAYRQTILRDSLGEDVIGSSNYDGTLPVIPLYANAEKKSELTKSIKAKIDAYDRIISDFGDNLDRSNDVYWVLNNFGGNTTDIATMIEQINRLKAVINVSDGTGSGSTAEPHTIDVPYAARSTALELLRKALYDDFMAVDMSSLTGSSLTNVAIRVACANLDMKVNRYEWQVFTFVQQILKLIGIKTEKIDFVRLQIANETETIQNIYSMREDIGRKKALQLNPYINPDEVDQIMQDVDAEETSGISTVDQLQQAIDSEQGDQA